MRPRYGPAGTRGHRITGRRSRCRGRQGTKTRRRPLAGATRAYSLLYSFTIGFCIEEQASAQAAAIGDNRFSEASRAARIDARAHPVIAQGGPQIFGDPDARFTDLVNLIIATAASLRV
jgi:hypothetical protein